MRETLSRYFGMRVVGQILVSGILFPATLMAAAPDDRAAEFDRINQAFETRLEELNEKGRAAGRIKYFGNCDASRQVLDGLDEAAVDRYLLEAEIRREKHRQEPDALFPLGPFPSDMLSAIFERAVKNGEREFVSRMLRHCPPSVGVSGRPPEFFMTQAWGLDSFPVVFESFAHPESTRTARALLFKMVERSFGASPDWIIERRRENESEKAFMKRISKWFAGNLSRLYLHPNYGVMSLPLYATIHDNDRGHDHMIGLFWCKREKGEPSARATRELFQSIEAMDQEKAMGALAAGVEPNAINDRSVPLLIAACEWGQIDVVKALLESGAEPEVADDFGSSPINAAVVSGNVDLVKFLIDSGADVNFGKEHAHRSHYFQAPLNFAVNPHADRKPNLAIVRMLIAAGADLEARDSGDWTPLQTAAECKDLAIVRILVEAGADPNAPSPEGWPEGNALFAAVASRNREIVNYLLKHGAEKSLEDLPPLHREALLGRRDRVEALLDAGTDPDIRDTLKRTALHQAATGGYQDLVALLLEKGAEPDPCNHFGETPLQIAVYADDLEIAKQLIEAGADVNQADAPDKRPLIWNIVDWSYFEMFKLLIESGVDANLTHSNQSLFGLAASRGFLEAVKVLAEGGADVNAPQFKGEDRKSPLYLAIEGDHLKSIDYLCSKGAILYLKGGYDSDVLGFKTDEEREQIMKILDRHGIKPTTR